jgi:hypothetical protein
VTNKHCNVSLSHCCFLGHRVHLALHNTKVLFAERPWLDQVTQPHKEGHNSQVPPFTGELQTSHPMARRYSPSTGSTRLFLGSAVARYHPYPVVLSLHQSPRSWSINASGRAAGFEEARSSTSPYELPLIMGLCVLVTFTDTLCPVNANREKVRCIYSPARLLVSNQFSDSNSSTV